MIGKLWRGVRIILMIAAATAALLQLGMYRQQELLAPPFAHSGGAAYAAQFTPAVAPRWLLHTPTSFDDRAWTSRLVLLEDGNLLERDDYHANIKDKGAGRFSHWGSAIYFSASDNSDPNRNGRSYAVEYPVLVHWHAAALLLICLLLLEFLVYALTRKRAERLSPRTALATILMTRPMPDRVYWLMFALILGCGIAFRVLWTFVLEVPFAYADTSSYYEPVISHPYFPFSEVRTAGLPMLISAALVLFRAPVGLLLLANLLALASVATLAIALKTVLHQRILSLLALFLFLFIPKDVALEYTLLSEHFSRCLYLAAAGCMLWLVEEPRRYWLSALLAGLVALNILVKPSAIILTIAVVLALGALALIMPSARRIALAKTTVLFVSLNLTLVIGYMAAFQQRFGTFDLTYFEGYNLYSHVGHLSVLESGVHPELKPRLKPVLTGYIDKYASKGRHLPNWLVYGATSSEVQNDLGTETPPRVIINFLQENKTLSTRAINQVFRDLALEGIWAHPIAYLRYSFDRAIYFWSEGYTLTYQGAWPRLSQHRADVLMQQEWLYKLHGQTVPACGSMEIVPANANVPMRNLFQGAFAPCFEPQYTARDSTWLIRGVADAFNGIWQLLSPLFEALPAAGLVGLAFTLLALPWSLTSGVRNLLGFGLLIALPLFGYSAFHGLVNVSEPPRMTANVQDLAVLMFLVFIACGLLQGRALILRVLPSQAMLARPTDSSEKSTVWRAQAF